MDHWIRAVGAGAGAVLMSCAGPPAQAPSSPASRAAGATFEEDVAFLTRHGKVVVLDAPGGGKVALSPTYQGRVMTSSVAPGGRSLGFVHRAFIESGATGTRFDNYGGEDRFWLGPEGGQFGLYFAPGKPYAFDAWQTPRPMQEGAWDFQQDGQRVVFTRRMTAVSHAGTTFTVDVRREVRLLGDADVATGLAVPLGGVQWVGFQTENRITNAGDAAWTEAGGLVSVWILGMFAPASDASIVIPFDRAGTGPIVNDRYFGKVPAERLAIHEGDRTAFLVMKADGAYRSKIGLGPARARSVAGSYSASSGLLTIVQLDRPAGATRYVNSMWEEQKDPYGGDVINAYNDGPTEPGKPSLGGFYELETSSPGAALAPGASLTHTHRTFHFVGPRAALEAIAQKALGVSLDGL